MSSYNKIDVKTRFRNKNNPKLYYTSASNPGLKGSGIILLEQQIFWIAAQNQKSISQCITFKFFKLQS